MFDLLIGNARAKDILRRIIRQRRIPGAMLFAGEDGVGKKLFALELAKALNCRSPINAEACGNCSSCSRINQLSGNATDDVAKQIAWTAHPDVGVVRPNGRFITVPQIRELERESYSRPFEGAARVLIIEDADRLNDVAANALLKTLEEPPSSSHLILITSRPAALLPTIRSRCQILRFTPLTAIEISDYLQTSQIAKTRKLATAADAPLIAQIAQGSIGRALALDLNSYREQRSLMIEILESLVSGADRAKLLRASESLSDPKQKESYEERLQILETLIHDLWTVKFGENTSSQPINYDLRPQLLRLANQVTLGRARRWLEQIDETRRQLAVNINRKVATDSLLLTMAETKARHALPGR